MTRNVGSLDRVARLAVAAVLFWLSFVSGIAAMQSGALFWLAVIAGAVMLVTALFGTCPIYRLFGLKTCKKC